MAAFLAAIDIMVVLMIFGTSIPVETKEEVINPGGYEFVENRGSHHIVYGDIVMQVKDYDFVTWAKEGGSIKKVENINSYKYTINVYFEMNKTGK